MDGGGGREVKEGEDICVHMADSRHCTADSNTLENSYTPMKKRRKKVKKNLSFQKKELTEMSL